MSAKRPLRLPRVDSYISASSGDGDEAAMHRAAQRGMPLADFECEHGKLEEEGCLECDPFIMAVALRIGTDDAAS